MSEWPDANEIKDLNTQLRNFQMSVEDGAFEYIEEQTKEMLQCGNKMILRELGRLIK